jgi:hypothetical protein
MRLVWGLGLVVACSDKDSGPAAGSTVSVDASGPIACVDPGLRSSERFASPPKAAPQFDQPREANLFGGGMVIEDLDDDGFLDLFLPSDDWVQLWWGKPGGLYDCTGNGCPAGQVDPNLHSLDGIKLNDSVGGSAADYDGDGDLDLVVTRWLLPPILLRNEGGRRFTDTTAVSGLGTHARRYQSASWADMDADGDLDLFLGTYGEFAKILEPDCSDHLADGSELWRNEGDGTFTEVSDLLPPELTDPVAGGYVFASGWYDTDDDGFPELFVSNDDGLCTPSQLVTNHGGSSFTTVDWHPQAHDMGMAVGDVNGDGQPDMALTSFQTVGLLESACDGGSCLWIESAQAKGLAVDSVSEHTQQAYGWGAEFGDLDNDADLDLAMNFGWWQNFDGTMDPRQQADGVWIQDASGMFSDQGADWGVADPGISRGVVLADLNDDGWLDIIKRILDDDTKMYVSRCGSEGWLRIKLRDQGANTHAIGAKVTVTAGGKTQTRWMQSGSSGQYTGSPTEVHFGLGAATAADIDVEWPDGEHTVTKGVDADQIVTLTRSP